MHSGISLKIGHHLQYTSHGTIHFSGSAGRQSGSLHGSCTRSRAFWKSEGRGACKSRGSPDLG